RRSTAAWLRRDCSRSPFLRKPSCTSRHRGMEKTCPNESERAMHRLFVAIRPPEPIRDLLIDAMDDSADFRWQDDEQLHLTLRFVGEVDRPVAEDLTATLGQIHAPRMELRIAGVGRFEQGSSGALWAGVEPKAPVAALAAKVERACQSAGLEPERRAFHPHFT